jgi:hypothetical protein
MAAGREETAGIGVGVASGGGDGAGPHVGAVVLPAEREGVEPRGGALPLRVF